MDALFLLLLSLTCFASSKRLQRCSPETMRLQNITSWRLKENAQCILSYFWFLTWQLCTLVGLSKEIPIKCGCNVQMFKGSWGHLPMGIKKKEICILKQTFKHLFHFFYFSTKWVSFTQLQKPVKTRLEGEKVWRCWWTSRMRMALRKDNTPIRSTTCRGRWPLVSKPPYSASLYCLSHFYYYYWPGSFKGP